MAARDPGGEPPTQPDPGRRRPAERDITELDPQRRRPRGGPSRAHGLPPLLDARFAVVRLLSRAHPGTGPASAGAAPGTAPGPQADVYLVRERSGDAQRVVKLYGEAALDQTVQAFLERKTSRHIVDVLESGTDAGRDYEIMEHLAGGSLTELRRGAPDGLDESTVTSVVRQLAEALTEMHEAGVVHRDVKPANVVVRTRDPIEVALIDFGISVHAPISTTLDDGTGTLRYMAPEYIVGGLVTPAYDWWSLGVSVLELATGRPILDRVEDPGEIRVHVTTRPLGVERIADERIRLLCRGLLVKDGDGRWGAEEVGRWLDGGTPPVPDSAGAAEPGATAVEVEHSYVYLDTEYRNRQLLAGAMVATWETAAGLLLRADREPLERLRAWLRQYPDMQDGWGDDAREPPDVRLLRLLRRMAPELPPIYRSLNITRDRLPEYARQATAGAGTFPEVVEQLWRYDLLPLLALGAAMADLGGGDGLGELDAAWREQYGRWRRTVSAISDAQARATLTGRDRAVRQRALALCLWSVATDGEGRAVIRRDVREHARRVRLPWFTELVDSPDGPWVAFALREHATDRAAQRDTRERAEAARRAWLSRNRRFREWSRRQNRPLALSWAVAGVFLMGVMCALLVSVSDIAGRVPGTTILDAWVATVFAVAATLTVESILSWEIGGRFHPRYSILGAGFIALGRAARTVAGRGLALGVGVAGLGGAYLLTVLWPVATPLVLGGATTVWAVARYLSWCADRDRELAAAELGARELLAAARP